MPTQPHHSLSAIQAAAQKDLERRDRAKTINGFITLLVVFAIVDLLGHSLLVGGGLPGYGLHILSMLRLGVDYPYLIAIFALSLGGLYYGIHSWRHRHDDRDRIAPPFPPIPDLRFSNDLYIGSGYTHDGKQPGDTIAAGEEVLNPHLIFNEFGLFANVHIKGGVGSGKTSTFIIPTIDQGINKYPKPHPPDHFQQDIRGRYKTSRKSPDDPFDRNSWNPYGGMNQEEAMAEYTRLLEEHEQKKWGFLIFDPKGDLAQFVTTVAADAGRSDDVVILRPDAEWTYNPLGVDGGDLVMAERFMSGIDAVTGGTMHQYYRQTGSEFLANALTVMKAATPGRVTVKNLLTMARSEDVRTEWRDQAERKMKEYQAEFDRYRRMGKRYTGPTINPAAIEFFMNWDGPDADPTQNRSVVSGIQAQAKYFVDEEMAPWLCPEMPPTFRGFHDMIETGKIVVFQMPLGQYGSVGRVLGILLLLDAQSAALERISENSQMNQDRVVAFIIDEVANYLNPDTKKFISMNRQCRVFCEFAHQSQGQLVTEADKGAEISFNDNLRSKISFSAPNAIAAHKESQLFGRREIIKQRESSSISLRSEMTNETLGGTISTEEIEKAWFNERAFLTLETGEFVVSEFDGHTTLDPRKVRATPHYKTPRGIRMEKQQVSIAKREPHPVLFVGGSDADINYIDTGLTRTGYVLVETLLDEQGGPAGLKFVTEAGTLLIPINLIRTHPEVYEMINKRLGESQGVLVLLDGLLAARILNDECGARYSRALQFPETLFKQDPETEEPYLNRLVGERSGVPGFRRLFQLMHGSEIPYLPNQGWKYHSERNDSRTWEIEEVSRKYLSLYISVSEALTEFGEDGVEDLYDEIARSVAEQLQQQTSTAATTSQIPPPPVVSPPPPPAQSQEVIVNPVARAPKTATPSSRKKTKARKKDSDVIPLFDLDELNEALKPSPFDEPSTPPPPATPAETGNIDGDSPDGSHDPGSNRESDPEATDNANFDSLPPDDLDANFTDDSEWDFEEDYPSDDDPLHP